jgi:hypothetical protein
MRSASPGGFTDRLPAVTVEDRPVSRQERRRKDRAETLKPVVKATLKPPPTTPQRRKQKSSKPSYKCPTVEDASSSSDSDSEEGSSDESDGEPAPVKTKKSCRNKIPSPLVSDTKRKTQPTFHQEQPQKPEQKPPRPDSSGYNSYASGASSARRTSFNDHVDVRTFTTTAADTRRDTRRNSRPSTAPDSSQSNNTWSTPNTSSFGSFPYTHSNAGRPNLSTDSERMRRQMYKGGVSSLAQEYLRKPSPPPSPTSDFHRGGYSDLAQEYLSPSPSRQHHTEKRHSFGSSGGAQDSKQSWTRTWTHRPSTAPSYQSTASGYHAQRSHHTAGTIPSYTSQPPRPKLPEIGFVIELADDESITGRSVSPASTKVHTGNDSSPLKPSVVPGAVAAA